MIHETLFSKTDTEESRTIHEHSLGNGFTLQIEGGRKGRGQLLHYGTPIKTANLADKAQKKLLVVEAVEISRQTIHNYRETHRYFGLED